MKSRFVPLLAAGLALAGCASDKFVGRPDLNVVNRTSLPRPSRPPETASSTYLIGPLDKLTVDVVGLPDTARALTVDPAGQIAVPLAGTIKAAGLTPTQLAAAITTRMRQHYVRDPQVSVNVSEILSQTVTVEGQVTAPGVYAFSGPITLLRSIARAQGVTVYAKTNYIVVYRTVDGQRYAGLYDLRAIRGGLYPDPEVLPNDEIVVGESGARHLFQDIISSAGLLTTPIVALAR